MICDSRNVRVIQTSTSYFEFPALELERNLRKVNRKKLGV